jgi:DNA-binding transcriptional MerR regulator
LLTLPLLEALASGRRQFRCSEVQWSPDELMMDSHLFTIGEFSKITGLTVKTLRFYHEEGLLEPTAIDDRTGYRYYAADKIERARLVRQLRELAFSLNEIRQIRELSESEGDVLRFLEQHKEMLAAKAEHYRQTIDRLDQIIHLQREGREIMTTTFEVTEKTIEPMRMAGVRMKGRYSDCSKGFSLIGRKLGRYICGPAFLLHYDSEYREDDADFEACFPIKPNAAIKDDGISIRDLPGGLALSLLHLGPYEKLGPPYEKILAHLKSKNRSAILPTREVYLKGPGMIFKGNPKKYLTEIQILVT